MPVLLPALERGHSTGPSNFNCVLTPQQTSGPFYFNARLKRSDITEGRPGIPLALSVLVVDVADCSPLAGAIVDLWHADKDGLYSGYPGQGEKQVDTSGATFCRGHQPTDGAGEAKFITMFPGWYPGRAPHIHFKVYIPGNHFVTSQMYPPWEVVTEVYGSPMYATRGQSPTHYGNDGVLRRSDIGKLTMTLEKTARGYAGSFIVGISKE